MGNLLKSIVFLLSLNLKMQSESHEHVFISAFVSALKKLSHRGDTEFSIGNKAERRQNLDWFPVY